IVLLYLRSVADGVKGGPGKKVAWIPLGASAAAKEGGVTATTATPATSKARMAALPEIKLTPRYRKSWRAAATLQHRRQDAVGRPVPVQESSDVDDHLLAHVDAAFERGRAPMRQQHHLAHARELDELRIDRRLVLEHVEPRARDVARRDQPHQRILVDHLAARGVDDVGLRANELEPARREQMKGRRRVRAVDRD